MDTVTVACKLPNGLTLEISDIEWLEIKGESVPRMSNTERHIVRGSAQARLMESNGGLIGETTQVVGGFGMTKVPAAFWDQWILRNKDYPPVKAGLIFAAVRDEKARDAAREFGPARRSGLEPITPPTFDAQGNAVGEVDPRLRRKGPRVETADAA